MNWEFFFAMFYGVILGLLGNLFVELFIQRYYPNGVPRKAAEIGMVSVIIVIILGMWVVLEISQML